MKLSLLLTLAKIEYVGEVRETEVTGIECDSRRVGEGCAFVALRGAATDGHKYAAEAYERGARVFLLEQDVDLPSDAICLTVSDTRAALADLSAAFYGFPSDSMTVIGITGTKGKTTTALLLSGILNRVGIKTGYIGTNGISYAGRELATENTTPESHILQRTMRDMLSCGVNTLVLEVSSQAIYQGRVRGLGVDIAAYTNLAIDHIGGAEHPTYEHYAECKRRLFYDYGAYATVYNLDDEMADFMCKDAPLRRISYGIESTADLRAAEISPTHTDNALGSHFKLIAEGREYEVNLPIPGRFNISNALCALGLARELGVELCSAIEALAEARVAGRFEVIKRDGVTYVLDYSHNGLSLRSALGVLREYTEGRLICLFGSVGDRTKGRRAELGLAASELADFCIVSSDHPGHEDPQAIIDEIVSNFKDPSVPHAEIPDRASAVRYAVDMARDGDVVLLAGKSGDTYQIVGDEHVPYSERDTLNDALTVVV